MHQNPPSHVSKLTREIFEHKKVTGVKIMEWLLSNPDLNLTENLWSILKMKLYERSLLYNKKPDPWEAITTTISEIEPAVVKKKINKVNVW